MWIGAHPDDEAFVAPLFGTLCAEGASVCSLLVITRGENSVCALSGGCGDLGTLRASEMATAATMLHADLTQWDLPDVMAAVSDTWSSRAGSHAALLATMGITQDTAILSMEA